MSSHGPVFSTGEFRDCGFSGVDDGRYFDRRRPLPAEKTGPEHDPDYTGYVLTVDRETLAGVYIMYTNGNATEIIITASFGPGGKQLFATELPAKMGIVKTRLVTDEANSHRIVTFHKDGEEWGRQDLHDLFEQAGQKTDKEMVRDLIASLDAKEE